MKGAAQGLLVAIVSAAAMTPLAWSVRASHESPAETEAKSGAKFPETLDVVALDKYLPIHVKKAGYVALSVAMVRDGRLILSHIYGESSRETGEMAQLDTAFAVGSITKQFTCAAAYMLAEEGKLSLDDKLSKYYPNLPRAGDITLADLGAHVSGYPDYYPLDFSDERVRHPIKVDELLAKYANKVDFEPGTRFSYSNTGYILLGRAVEKATFMPLGEFMRVRFFGPLGMGHTWYEPKEGSPGLARGYGSFELGDPEPAEREASGWLGAAGGIYASANNLALWDLALMDGKVLKPETLRKMATPYALKNGHPTGYGCGLSMGQVHDETVYSHGGEVNGFLAYNVMIPRTHSALILMANDQDVDLAELKNKLLDLLVKADEPPVPKVDGRPAEEVAREMFEQMQGGTLDRSLIGADFSAYVTPARGRVAAQALAPLGVPKRVEVLRSHERGGMEVTNLRFTFEKQTLSGVMARSKDGKVQEFLLERQ
jgi:CubicO group peptidase (beta-lactamase class C family)